MFFYYYFFYFIFYLNVNVYKHINRVLDTCKNFIHVKSHFVTDIKERHCNLESLVLIQWLTA